MLRHVTTRFSGLIILIAGIWGGLIPFLGPTFNFTLGPNVAWHWTTGRLWLDVLPAAAAVLGGLILMGYGPRLSGKFGALLALAGGVWFAVGPDVSMLWNHGVSQAGVAHGHHTITRMLEFLTLHSGIGVLITAFAAFALPGIAGSRRRAVERDAAVAGTGAAVATERRGTFGRRREAAAEPVEAAPAAGGPAATERRGMFGGRQAAAGEPVETAPPAAGGTEAPQATPAAEREPVAPDGYGAGNGVASEEGAAAEPVEGGTQTQTTSRRRRGLFSRR